jgi:hypothetical protein
MELERDIGADHAEDGADTADAAHSQQSHQRPQAKIGRSLIG